MPETCCCCFTLKTGSHILGIFSIINFFGGFIWSQIAAYTLVEDDFFSFSLYYEALCLFMPMVAYIW